MKIVTMCNNSTKYMVNAILYLGKGTVPNKMSAASYFVEKLIAPAISGTNCNVMVDSCFMSILIAEHLLEESKEK